MSDWGSISIWELMWLVGLFVVIILCEFLAVYSLLCGNLFICLVFVFACYFAYTDLFMPEVNIIKKKYRIY